MATDSFASERLVPIEAQPARPVDAGVRVGHIHLKVADLDRAIGFYRDVLGFELTQRYGTQAAFLSAGGYHHHLGTNTWSAGPAADDRYARLLSWELVLPRRQDAEAAVRSLADAGHRPAASPNAWTVADRWGTPLRIVIENSSVPDPKEITS